MADENECGIFSPEALAKAVFKTAQQGFNAPDRMISTRASRLLRKIHQKYPYWDSWHSESEIWFKAYNMGILEDE